MQAETKTKAKSKGYLPARIDIICSQLRRGGTDEARREGLGTPKEEHGNWKESDERSF